MGGGFFVLERIICLNNAVGSNRPHQLSTKKGAVQRLVVLFFFCTTTFRAFESSPCLCVRKGKRMRRLLNLNQPSTMFLKVIGFFVVLIPAVLYGIVQVWSGTGSVTTLLLSMIKVSFVVGAFVFIVFLVLIVVEQIQDHYYNIGYQKQRNRKTLLANGYYECQYCGNQKVREHDKSCNICGKEFTLERSK